MPLFGKPRIPNNLPRGGKLSEFGGPNAAAQYRVWLTSADGRRFFMADPEFAGIVIAWRKAQQDMDYYTNIETPVAVVWDRGLRSYREVVPDTLVPRIIPPSAEAVKEVRKKKEAQKEQSLEEEERKRISDYLSAVTPAETKTSQAYGKRVTTGKGKEKKIEFISEATSELQKEELKEAQQSARAIAQRAAEIAAEEKGQGIGREEENPKSARLRAKKGQLVQAFGIREPAFAVDRSTGKMARVKGEFHYPFVRVDLVTETGYEASDYKGNHYFIPLDGISAINTGWPNPKQRNLTPKNESWGDRPYRGRTSMNMAEMLHMKNKQVVGAWLLLGVGVVALVLWARSRRTTTP